jgi:hypothetical protein
MIKTLLAAITATVLLASSAAPSCAQYRYRGSYGYGGGWYGGGWNGGAGAALGPGLGMKTWKKRGSVPSSRDALLLWGEPKMRVKDQLQNVQSLVQ